MVIFIVFLSLYGFVIYHNFTMKAENASGKLDGWWPTVSIFFSYIAETNFKFHRKHEHIKM